MDVGLGGHVTVVQFVEKVYYYPTWVEGELLPKTLTMSECETLPE